MTVILPLFLKTPLLEKVRREVLTAVKHLNFIRLGTNVLCLIPSSAYYIS